MSSYNQLGGGHLVASGGADNLGATFTSKVVAIESASGVGFEVKVDNTVLGSKDAAGTYSFEISNSMINWIPLVLSSGATTVAVAAATDNTDFLDLGEINARYIRFSYTRSGGNGVCDVYCYVRRVR